MDISPRLLHSAKQRQLEITGLLGKGPWMRKPMTSTGTSCIALLSLPKHSDRHQPLPDRTSGHRDNSSRFRSWINRNCSCTESAVEALSVALAPGLAPSAPAQPDIAWSWQDQTAMAWRTAPGHILPDEALRFALQKHLGLPVFQQGQRCAYTPPDLAGDATTNWAPTVMMPSCAPRGRVCVVTTVFPDTWIHLCRKAG